ncbi:pyridoxamine 5'-phosphate oxidase family protein [Marinomonas transparens]|uniref:Pyridoxamine 5'-phosphate oxidase family protein n=1 Tax=Marinomonas transparens TaxID=2795388 RepID=A0A934JV70_9GAMM|nr:pyridoxamine 5'-phosphate oxidase family protein [Marinomonas transparens]MBJ7537642.1 pyridoxamine 5'-phosphate oxidase family protein [Marinomonas transparens]
MLTAEIKQSIDESVLCWLATVDADGSPNCSPKEIFTYFGDTQLIIANIASPNSVSNIETHSNVCISFVHVLKQKGFKLKGRAIYADSTDASYKEQLDLLKSIAGTAFPIKGVILIDVSSAERIIAPGYYLVEGATEESQIESAKRAYGV